MDTRNPDPTVCVSNTFFKVSPLYEDSVSPAIFVKVMCVWSLTIVVKAGLNRNAVIVALPADPLTAGAVVIS